jgi:hypothetical protein
MPKGGLPLSSFEEDRFSATVQASDQARKLSLAGVAIVWLFAGPFFRDTNEARPSDLLFFAGGLLSVALALDLAQMVTRALMLDYTYNKFEARPDVQEALRRDEDPQVYDLGRVHTYTYALFLAKLLALGSGYFLIIFYFATQAF